jgi:hypothetical protein
MTKETFVARNCTDVATTDDETKWCRSVFDFAAQVADAAKPNFRTGFKNMLFHQRLLGRECV